MATVHIIGQGSLSYNLLGFIRFRWHTMVVSVLTKEVSSFRFIDGLLFHVFIDCLELIIRLYVYRVHALNPRNIAGNSALETFPAGLLDGLVSLEQV